MGIRIGCHKWSFSECSVQEAASITRTLGFECMDLGSSADLDLVYIADHLDDEVERLNRIQRETGVRFIDAVPQATPPFANNHPDARHRTLHRRLLGAFFDLAQRIGLDGVSLSPGRYWPSEAPKDSFKRGAEELRWAVTEGQERGLKIRIEPHVRSITWTPELAVEMVKLVPGLSLTIDHSHFAFFDLPYEQIEIMHPYATHWHARQARPGELQCRWEVGQIDFARIATDLRSRQYDGVICLEYVHSPWMQQDNVDCVRETVLLRNHLRELLD